MHDFPCNRTCTTPSDGTIRKQTDQSDETFRKQMKHTEIYIAWLSTTSKVSNGPNALQLGIFTEMALKTSYKPIEYIRCQEHSKTH